MNYSKCVALLGVQWRQLPDGDELGGVEYDPENKVINIWGDTETKNPIEFDVQPITSALHTDFFDIDIVIEEDFTEWIIKGFDWVLNGNKFRKQPTFGEFELVVEVTCSSSPSTPNAPAEYDMDILCLGVLGLNYNITKND